MSVEKSKSDVILVIDGMTIHCERQLLAQNSTYFQSMFFSSFAEKNEKEIVIKGIVLEDFMVFLDAINGINRVTDENVENALALSIFLGSSELEKMCMTHLAQGSKIPLKEQFYLAEKYCSENLMIQVCSYIKDAYELDEVVPKDLDSFCNTTKNIILQRSFELLGIRKPSLPPQPEDPIIAFEGLMGELLDQADLQNHHGMILADQAALLSNNLICEEVLDREVPQAKPTIQQDPRIHELMEELRDTHSPAERNAVRAQVLVVKYKNMYTTLIEMGAAPDHPLGETILLTLDRLYIIINRNQRDRSKLQASVRGEMLIDRIYRRTIETVEGRLATEAPQQNIGFEPLWVATINRTGQSLPWRPEVTPNIRQGIFNSFRRASAKASFLGLEYFVQIAREWFFLNLMRKMQQNQIQNQAEQNMQQ